MTTINKSAEKLNQLIEGTYPDVGGSPWGMEEYNHFERNYLNPLTDDEKVKVFRIAYEQLGEDKLAQNIKRLFYFASVYTVKFSKEYINIIRTETSEIKKQSFFQKACYYIDDRWSQKAKDAVTEKDRDLIKKLCEKYNVSYPLD